MAMKADSAPEFRPSSNAIYIDGVEDNDEYTGLNEPSFRPKLSAISRWSITATFAVRCSAGGSWMLKHGPVKCAARRRIPVVQNGALNGTPGLNWRAQAG